MGPIPFVPLRNHPSRHEDDIIEDDTTSSSDDSRENENKNENYRISYMLFTPTLEDLKNVLYVALNPFFEEFEIAVVSCPCLTRPPFKLAAAGLSGNTGIFKMGSFRNFSPKPQTNVTFNIKDILSTCSYDAFVIGSGFAAEPSMPYNGQLTMNAVVSTNHSNVINNSCIAFKRVDELRLEINNDHNQIKCSLFGHFFFSEAKRGPVIKIRAKGRRSRYNVITLIQIALSKRCQDKPLIGLGIVLVLNGGQTDQFIIPDNFVRYYYNTYDDYYDRLRVYTWDCKNLIALGALTSKNLEVAEKQDGTEFLRDENTMFNTFSNYESPGQFYNDVSPEKTEYILYINIAQERCS